MTDAELDALTRVVDGIDADLRAIDQRERAMEQRQDRFNELTGRTGDSPFMVRMRAELQAARDPLLAFRRALAARIQKEARR